MATTAGFAYHLVPGIRDIVGTSFKNWEAFYSKYVHVETSERAWEEYMHAAGLPMAVPRSEGTPIPFFDPFEGSKITVTHSEYSIGFQVSKEMWDDDLYKAKSAVRKASKSLARSMSERVEVQTADLFNNTGTTYLCPDGVSLFNTQHKKLIGPRTYEATGSQSNSLGAIDLTQASVAYATLMFQNWTDDRGIKIWCKPTTLITSNGLTGSPSASTVPSPYAARVQMGTDRLAGSPNWDINPVFNAFPVEMYPYLTDEDAWFLWGPDHHLTFLWRERPTMDSFDDKNTRTAKFASFMRFSVCAPYWTGITRATG